MTALLNDQLIHVICHFLCYIPQHSRSLNRQQTTRAQIHLHKLIGLISDTTESHQSNTK